jgi:type VI secretion system protein
VALCGAQIPCWCLALLGVRSMLLQLSVLSYQDREPEDRLSRRFEGASIRVGRSPDNDFVLPDPESHVSKRHCIIEMKDGRYVLTDTSTNGVFINDAGRAVGSGGSAILSDGDHLLVGRYEIMVEIAGPAAFSAASIAERDAAGPFGVEQFQPLAGPSGGISPAAAVSDPPPFVSSLIPEGFDWLGAASTWPSTAASSAVHREATPADHVPAERAFFRPPAVSSPIPNDWSFAADEARSRPDRPASAVADKPARLSAGEVFLEGAGLAGIPALQDDPEVLRRAGEIFRAMVDGMCALLATRAMIKGEYRVDQTQIRSTRNNPLKFTRDGAEAATLLLTAGNPGYLPGVAAVAEGFRDLKTHELALMAGMQGAAAALFRQFDPEQLKQRLDRHSILASVLPSARRARYWEIYEQEYRKIAQDVSNDARGQFGTAFSRAYEEQERKL